MQIRCDVGEGEGPLLYFFKVLMFSVLRAEACGHFCGQETSVRG